jgi:hypothetical protein
MTLKKKRTTRKALRLAALGQFIGGAPPFRERAEIVRAELAEGVPRRRCAAASSSGRETRSSPDRAPSSRV